MDKFIALGPVTEYKMKLGKFNLPTGGGIGGSIELLNNYLEKEEEKTKIEIKKTGLEIKYGPCSVGNMVLGLKELPPEELEELNIVKVYSGKEFLNKFVG